MTKLTTQTHLEQFQAHVRHLPRKPKPIINCEVCGVEVAKNTGSKKPVVDRVLVN